MMNVKYLDHNQILHVGNKREKMEKMLRMVSKMHASELMISLSVMRISH